MRQCKAASSVGAETATEYTCACERAFGVRARVCACARACVRVCVREGECVLVFACFEVRARARVCMHARSCVHTRVLPYVDECAHVRGEELLFGNLPGTDRRHRGIPTNSTKA